MKFKTMFTLLVCFIVLMVSVCFASEKLVVRFNKPDKTVVKEFLNAKHDVAASDSLFLLNVGVEKLPVIYTLMPFMMLCYFFAYSHFRYKLGLNRFFEFTLGVLFFGGILFFLLITFFKGENGFYYVVSFSKLYSSLGLIVICSLTWSYTNNYFDDTDNERFFSLFVAGSALGVISAGILIIIFTRFASISSLFLLWSATILMVFPVLKWINRTEIILDTAIIEEHKSIKSKEQTVVSTINQSHYVSIMLCIMILAQVLASICEYNCMNIFSKNVNEIQLINLFGKLFIFVNIFNVLVSSSLFNRMAARLGTRNIALLQPIVYSIAFTFLFMNYAFNAALFGFFAYQGFMLAINENNSQLLLNAFPKGYQEAKFFFKNMLKAVATGIAGILLLVCNLIISVSTLSLLALGIVVFYLICVFIVRNEHLVALVRNLKQNRLIFSKDPNTIVNKLTRDRIDQLVKRVESRKGTDALIAIQILWINDKKTALKTFLKYLDSNNIFRQNNKESNEFYQAGLVLSKIIRESCPENLDIIIDWVEKEQIKLSSELMEEVIAKAAPQPKYYNMAHSTNHERIVIGTIALWKSMDPGKKKQATVIIQKLLKGNKADINIAIRIMGRTNDELYSYYILSYLDNIETKKSAVNSICQLVNTSSKRMIPNIIKIIENGGAHYSYCYIYI